MTVTMLGRATIAMSLIGVALLSSSCSRVRNLLPPSPPVEQVMMREYRFDYSTPIHRGRVVFEIHNAGQLPHRLALIPLPPGAPSLADMLSGANPLQVTPVAGIPMILPATSDSFAVDLLPGRYLVIDFGVGADHRSYARSGMASEFMVT